MFAKCKYNRETRKVNKTILLALEFLQIYNKTQVGEKSMISFQSNGKKKKKIK